MRGSIWGGLALVTAALAMPVLGQTGGDQTASSEDAPNKDQKQHYTAELKMTTVRTLSNGTTITLESTMVMAVDSQGRSMNSNTDMWEPGGQKPFTRVTAYDPVAGTQTVWTSPGLQAIVTTLLPQPPVKSSQSGCFLFYKTATNPTTGAKTALPAPGIAVQLTGTAMKSSSGPAGLGIEQESSDYHTVVEDLGTATFLGVKAHGVRVIRTTPVGTAGNDQPLVNTEENWISTGTNPRSLLLHRMSNDPEFGKSTTELVNLSLDEPDLSTFQPPKDYQIVMNEMHILPCKSSRRFPFTLKRLWRKK